MASWKQRNMGVYCGNQWLCLLIWAVNLFFFARTKAVLRVMMQETTDALEKAHLYWKEESLEFVCSLEPETRLENWAHHQDGGTYNQGTGHLRKNRHNKNAGRGGAVGWQSMGSLPRTIKDGTRGVLVQDRHLARTRKQDPESRSKDQTYTPAGVTRGKGVPP